MLLRSDPRISSAMTNDAAALTLLSQLHVEIMRTSDPNVLTTTLGQYTAIAAARVARRRNPSLPSAVTNPYESMLLTQTSLQTPKSLPTQSSFQTQTSPIQTSLATSPSAMEQLRLQMSMDRLSKMMSTISNLLKKASEEANGITQNIK